MTRWWREPVHLDRLALWTSFGAVATVAGAHVCVRVAPPWAPPLALAAMGLGFGAVLLVVAHLYLERE